MEPVCNCGHAADDHGPKGNEDSRLHPMGCHHCPCLGFVEEGGEEVDDDREDGPDFPLDEPEPDGDAGEELGEAPTEVDITVIPRGDA
jgi:hypothetical protein